MKTYSHTRIQSPQLKLITLALLICALIFLPSCAVERRLETPILTPFLDVPGLDPTSKLKNLPFDHSWAAADFDPDKYSMVKIIPVTTKYLDTDKWRESMSVAITSKDSYKAEVKELANYATEQQTEAFNKSDKNRYLLSQVEAQNTLILEMSLSEVIFGNPLASAGALAAPIPGAGVAASAFTDPSVAFELRIRDATNKRVLATVADRAFPTARIVNLNKLTASSACREIVQDWTKLVVLSLNQGKFAQVSRKSFELTPW